MEAVVLLAHAGVVAVRRRLPPAAPMTFHFVQRRFVAPYGCQTRRDAAEEFKDLEEVCDLAELEIADARTSVGEELNQTLRLQPQKGFTHQRARNPIILGGLVTFEL